MNQSNKALRELADMFWNIHGHRDEAKRQATEAYALVTNYIKGKMPKKKSVFTTENVQAYTNGGYNQALEEVQQLLEEISNADQ